MSLTIRTRTIFHACTTPPVGFNEVLGQCDVGQSTGQQQPPVIGDDLHPCPPRRDQVRHTIRDESDLNRLTVRSPKTEHHEGKGERIIPLFPEIREHLLEAFESALVGSDNVISRYREGANLNPHFRRIIKRSGLTPWDRTWHNLRASRQTELAASFPLHTVCAWIGNTKAIAAGHDLQVTDADWTRATASEKAAANPATHTRQSSPTASKPKTQNPQNSRELVGVGVPCDPVESRPMGRAGLEPATLAFSVPCSTN
jgi:hypothetical protein